jgi:hypothetical protein
MMNLALTFRTTRIPWQATSKLDPPFELFNIQGTLGELLVDDLHGMRASRQTPFLCRINVAEYINIF